MLASGDSRIFFIFGTIFLRRAEEPPDLTIPSSSSALMTPSESSSTMHFKHLAMLGLTSRTSITAPKSYSTKLPSDLTPTFPGWGSACTRPISITLLR
ncbi:hypothetical protein ATCV1_z088L [Acanthocystis turfacea chlorella virus 1]|uniref:Uncharacterized protein z088L n=1 Tax=Chlorovirus heliozoae TaxID=322019 RepID=A7K848_9PHYC|nr:hypothetical protein ATCV1_z088L [Acanthocystis turfacea chlorella virus 1]ABT16222.1 hypothetical protein ATCV1_z088L [Acanthocystis turfacea chlorella virus 1]